jgi:CspA family cold shock protein
VFKGTVKRVVREKGFGFLKCDDGREIFFHASGLIGGAIYKDLKEGQIVEFEVEKGPKGAKAFDIKVVG